MTSEHAPGLLWRALACCGVPELYQRKGGCVVTVHVPRPCDPVRRCLPLFLCPCTKHTSDLFGHRVRCTSATRQLSLALSLARGPVASGVRCKSVDADHVPRAASTDEEVKTAVAELCGYAGASKGWAGMGAATRADLVLACKLLTINHLVAISEDAAKYKGTYGTGLGEEMCARLCTHDPLLRPTPAPFRYRCARASMH